MKIYGFPVNYDGDFGDLPVLQAGRFKILAVRDYDAVPVKLGILLIRARQVGAQFLIIDPDPVNGDYPLFLDVRIAA